MKNKPSILEETTTPESEHSPGNNLSKGLIGLTNFHFPESPQDLQDDELLAWRLRQTIINMVAFGVPKEEIATLMRTSTQELEQAYPHELQTGARQLEVNLENNLVNLALYSPDPRVSHKASLDLLRHKFGWKEAAPRGAGNGLSLNVVFHLPDQVSAEEWQTRADNFRRTLVINSTPEEAVKK